MMEKIEHSQKLIREVINQYPKIALACSFGKDSMVLLHLVLQIKSDISIFTIMTPFKPRETLEFKDFITKLWNLNIKEYIQEDNIGAGKQKLWLNNPEKCCEYFKVAPTQKAINGLEAWITGLRNTEGETRKDFKEIEYKKIIKINPILNWTELDIWRYIAFNQIPIHPWYKNGYRSLGCQPCTTIITDDESERSGRWQGTNKCGGECGIHTKI